MFNKSLITLSLFLLYFAPAFGAEIRHFESNGGHLIDTSPTNYAISAPSLLQNLNWKSVSVNGNNVVILKPNCESILKTLDSLGQNERSSIEAARNQLMTQQQFKYSVSSYSLVPGLNGIHSTRGVNVNFSSFNHNGMSIVKSDENDFSASKQGMPNNLARIFVSKEVATYVYLNGEVQMKPTACLQPSEVQMNQQIKAEAQQAEAELKRNMQNMQQNMQNMQHNMQQQFQNMQQNMQHNMQNMFGNGFPFNNHNNMMNYGNQMMMNNGNQYMQQSYDNMQNGYNSNFAEQHQSNTMNPFASNFMQNFNPLAGFGTGFPFGR